MTRATIATDLGDIEVELYDQSAPKAAANFVNLAEEGLLRRRRLPPRHPGLRRPGRRRRVRQEVRLDKGRVGTGGPGYKFEDEPVQGDYVRGALAMANAGPNTNGSQFFICHQDLTGKLPEELHAVRPGDQGDGRRRQDRRRPARQPGPAARPGRDDLGDHPRRGDRVTRRLRNLHREPVKTLGKRPSTG